MEHEVNIDRPGDNARNIQKNGTHTWHTARNTSFPQRKDCVKQPTIHHPGQVKSKTYKDIEEMLVLMF